MPAYRNDPADELTGTLSPLPLRTATSAVAAQLLAYFTGGGVTAGSRLPPERQLAQMLGTGRSAVREALAALEILGIVDVRPGSGTYLRGQVSELLPRTLSWGMMLGEHDTSELVEVRTQLEVLASQLAAERIDDAGLGRLATHLADMRRNENDFVAFVEADMHFHQEIAFAAGNSTLGGLLQSLRSLLRIWVDRSIAQVDQARDAIAEHDLLLQALTTRDPAASANAMAMHMQTAAARLTHTKPQDQSVDV
jgi:GntR family transcriptional repressor for pyruvate dehydrogenase complex